MSREPRGQRIQPEAREGFLRVVVLALGFEGRGSSPYGKLEKGIPEGTAWVKARRLKQHECGALVGSMQQVSMWLGQRMKCYGGPQTMSQGAAGSRSGRALGAVVGKLDWDLNHC